MADHVATGWPSFQPSELVTIRSMFFASFNWFQPVVTNRLLIPSTMHTHGFDFDCGGDEKKGGYCTSGQIL